MTLAFMFVIFDTLMNDEKTIERIQKLQGVIETHITYGIYDAYVKIKVETKEELQLLTSRIRSIDNVHSTNTMLVID